MIKPRVHRHEVVQPLDQSIRLIPLTQGQNAIVDTKDYKLLNRYNWCAKWKEGTKSFYAVRRKTYDCVSAYMSRVVLGCGPNEEADHMNHNTLDNRRCNLRKSTHQQNCFNRRMYRNNASGVKGVYWDSPTNKWCASIHVNGRHLTLGRFTSMKMAAAAYCKASTALHGEFGHHD